MDVIKQIKVTYKNKSQLEKLDCVQHIELISEREIAIRLKDECTEGLPVIQEGEYLIQWKTGKWQRFGAESYNKLCTKPSKDNR